MQIQWLGQSYFKIQTKNNGDDITIVTDPYGTKHLKKVPKTQADIVTISHDHDDHNNLKAVKGEPFVISDPGEYETKGAFIYGIPSFHDDKEGEDRGNNIIYRINIEGINLVHLGDLGHKLNEDQLEKINGADILLIPVGGTYTIDAKAATEIIAQIEPRIVIPMHYKIPNATVKLDPVDNFLKIAGSTAEKMDKLKITKNDLPVDETKIVVLNC